MLKDEKNIQYYYYYMNKKVIILKKYKNFHLIKIKISVSGKVIIVDLNAISKYPIYEKKIIIKI